MNKSLDTLRIYVSLQMLFLPDENLQKLKYMGIFLSSPLPEIVV